MTYFKPLIKNFELFNALIQVSIAKGSLNFRTIHDKNTKPTCNTNHFRPHAHKQNHGAKSSATLEQRKAQRPFCF
ncbi:hypothetical protein BGL76_04105 [Helicobacter pylori]|nr:hypothetical protein OA23_05850 [Helicobacter pylori]OPG32661.1 hypothetical protein BGL65_05650 [Helicobacter pylori]OPG43876.1 hypothetical protein BGL75_05630 [Helicobacter pylori]OPG54202.1 hypothetical protein BGL76_04105 [Helicobacter pylori]PDW56805.1 hypothetical protein BB440_04390 [Helicobacter pylori]